MITVAVVVAMIVGLHPKAKIYVEPTQHLMLDHYLNIPFILWMSYI